MSSIARSYKLGQLIQDDVYYSFELQTLSADGG